MEQQAFIDTLNSVAAIVRTSQVPMTDAEILSYFSDMELSEGQKKMVTEYVKNPEEREDLADNEQETDANSKVYQMYLEDLKGIPAYSEEEKISLYRELLEGNQTAIEPIAMFSLEMVLRVAKRYLEPKLLVEDIIQEGNMALFTKLNELCGCKKSYDVAQELEMIVESAIVTYASEQSNEWEQENTLVGKMSLVYEARKYLAEENGAIPTIDELADYTKMSKEELLELDELMKNRK